MTDTQADLLARCRAGDNRAWCEFVERYSRYVYAIAVRGFRLQDADAEDVFQDVFFRAYEHLGDVRSDDAVKPWLAQLTRRLCVDRLRARARERPEEFLPDAVDETLADLDQALAVHAALGSLPERCGEILDRFFARDESYRTIAAELGLPQGTIASRISRCLRRLREMLEGRSSGAGTS